MDLSKYTLDKFEVPGRPTKIARLLDETIHLSYKNGMAFVKTAKDYGHGMPYSSDVSVASAVSEIVKEWLKSKSEYVKYERELNEYKERLSKHQAELHRQFKKELFDELGISDNPKREMLFSKAWEQGHGCGYAEVYNYACDLVDLIQ